MPPSSQIVLASAAMGAGECLSAEHERNEVGNSLRTGDFIWSLNGQ